MKNIIKIIKHALEIVLGLIYPNSCIFCTDIVEKGSEKDYICRRCSEELEFCVNGENENLASVFEYKGRTRDMIHRFKFGFHPEYAPKIADIMLCRLNSFDFSTYDFIVPVPMHPEKQRKRGYNQAELVAENVGKGTGVENCRNMLIRVKKTVPQIKLDRNGRAENVKNAFAVREKGFFKEKKIILIDDIYTTGSTAEECIRTLKEDGAEEVFVISVCKTVKTNNEA